MAENKYIWDLTYFYADKEDFLKDLEELKALGGKMASYQGQLHEEGKLVEYLRLEKKLNLLLEKLYGYSHLKADRDRKNVENVADQNKVELAFSSILPLVAFEEPELISLGKEKLDAFLEKYPEFDEFSFQFEKLFLGQKHVLTPDKEKLLSAFSNVLGEGSTLYSTLSVADAKGKKITLSNGEEVEVNQATWSHLIPEAPTAEDRQAIFEALYSHYENHKNTYAEIYNAAVQADLATKNTRGYDSILALHLEGNKIPLEVFKTLIEVASTHTEPLKRYYEIRRKRLGLEKHRSYDRFLKLAEAKKKYTYEEAKELFFDSIKHFPEDYQNKAHEVLREGFVDVYPSDGKRTGAYSSGAIDSHPFILLNYVGDLEDVFTLAHESGHSIHTLYAEEAQPGIKQNYTIFVAEIASTFNEHNLIDYLLKSKDLDKDDKIFLLQKAIDEIASTFYRQTLFGHYEYEVSKLAEAGEPLNYEVLCRIMTKLYRDYYGIDITEEKLKPFVWAYIPHLFYTPFYVYQYATSFTSSMLIYEKVKEGVPGAFENHINLLKSGGSDYPVDQVKKAGVDLTTPEPYLAVVSRMNELLDQLEALLKE